MKKTTILIITLILLALTAAGCSGRRITTSGWPGLTVHEDLAYLASGPHVYAVNLANGTLKWQFPAEQQRDMTFYAPPAVLNEDQLIVAGYDDILHSINPENGQENWSYDGPKDRLIAEPLVTDQAIFVTSADHYLYAVDHQGNQLWEPFETEEPIWAAPVWSEDCECVVIASMDHRVYAVDPETGTEIWQTEDLGGPIVSKPAVSDDGILYVSTFNNEIIAMDVETQSIRWRFTTTDWAWAAPIIAGEQLYVSDLAGNFYALDRSEGEQLWVLNPGGRIVSAPLVMGENVYFGTDQGSLVVASSEGAIQRSQDLTGKIYTSPDGSQDIFLVAPTEHDDLLLAFDENGAQLWNFSPSDD
jgi:outer membrane protein assembly factor BamB